MRTLSKFLRPLGRQSGQASVEFALVVPLLLLLVVGLVELALATNYWLDLTHVANQGARLAAVNASGGGNLPQYVQGQLESTELRQGGSASVANPARVCVSFPNGSGNVGDPVKVSVSAAYKLIPFVGGATIALAGSSTMRLEQPATSFSAGCYP